MSRKFAAIRLVIWIGFAAIALSLLWAIGTAQPLFYAACGGFTVAIGLHLADFIAPPRY